MEAVRYIDRTTDYYRSQGYDKPYAWARNDSVPFARLAKPLAQCRVGLLSTSEIAIRFDPATESNPISEEGFRAVYEMPADVPTAKLYSRTSSFDRYATHLEDANAFFPVDRLREAAASGRIGSMPPRLYGAYNNYSQRKVREEEAPKVLGMARADALDAAILVPV